MRHSEANIGLRVTSKEGTLRGIVLDMEFEKPRRIKVRWDAGREEWVLPKDLRKEL